MDTIWREARETMHKLKMSKLEISMERFLCLLADNIGSSTDAAVKQDFLKLASLLYGNDVISELEGYDKERLVNAAQSSVDRLQALGFIEPRIIAWLVGGLIYTLYGISPKYDEMIYNA